VLGRGGERAKKMRTKQAKKEEAESNSFEKKTVKELEEIEFKLEVKGKRELREAHGSQREKRWGRRGKRRREGKRAHNKGRYFRPSPEGSRG